MAQSRLAHQERFRPKDPTPRSPAVPQALPMERFHHHQLAAQVPAPRPVLQMTHLQKVLQKLGLQHSETPILKIFSSRKASASPDSLFPFRCLRDALELPWIRLVIVRTHHMEIHQDGRAVLAFWSDTVSSHRQRRELRKFTLTSAAKPHRTEEQTQDARLCREKGRLAGPESRPVPPALQRSFQTEVKDCSIHIIHQGGSELFR